MNQGTKISEEISLIEIFYELKKKKYVLLLFVIIAFIGVSIYKILVPKKYTYESSFTFLVDKNINNRSSLLGNSSVLNNNNLYLDINISDVDNSINAFKNISPNSYEDILNTDSALLYFSNLPLPNGKSLLDSLKTTSHTNITNDDDESIDISLIKKYFNYKKIFTSKYSGDKNIVSITVATRNKSISKWLSYTSIKYITQYIHNIQNQKLQQQFNAIKMAIEENKVVNHHSIEDKKLNESIDKILTKQLYEYKIKSALIDNYPFNLISTSFVREKMSTSILYVIAIVVGLIAGSLWIFTQKMWIDFNKNSKK